MIVGADSATDQTILSTSANLYGSYRLKRVYYSAFSPIPDASRALPLSAPPLAREHRLYQADWLMRFYGFDVGEIVDKTAGMLSLDIDPKLAWALRHRDRFPLDVNRASREDLLRVPGFGTKAVDRIIATRRLTSDPLRRSGETAHSPEQGPAFHRSQRSPTVAASSGQCRTVGAVQTQGDATRIWILMHITLHSESDFDGWRKTARMLVLDDVKPAEVTWSVRGNEPGLFETPDNAPLLETPSGTFRVPAKFVDLAKTAILHRDPERFALLYRLLWRLRRNHDLLDVATDADVAQIAMMAKAVRRDEHKMHAFVRFREIGSEPNSHFVAWFEPEHHIVELAAPFFARRFADMAWSILTPEACAHWDGRAVSITPGVPKAEAPTEDRLEETWRRYYASIFNPARLKVKAMQKEMPKKYWRNLPEASLIKPLIEGAERLTGAMIDKAAAEPHKAQKRPEPAMARKKLSSSDDIETLREEAADCRACPLWKDATQTVFGEGPQHASLMLVGEQPGDKEDLAGRPFVGPAGQMLDRALEEAGIERRQGLRHQRRQTFQIRAARKNPAAPEAEHIGNQGMPAMVRTRAQRDQTGSGGGDGRHRRTKRVRQDHADQQEPRPRDRTR